MKDETKQILRDALKGVRTLGLKDCALSIKVKEDYFNVRTNYILIIDEDVLTLRQEPQGYDSWNIPREIEGKIEELENMFFKMETCEYCCDCGSLDCIKNKEEEQKVHAKEVADRLLVGKTITIFRTSSAKPNHQNISNDAMNELLADVKDCRDCIYDDDSRMENVAACNCCENKEFFKRKEDK